MSNQIDETVEGSSHSGEEKITSFNELGIEPKILKALGEMGFVTPTPIQSQALPILLSTEHDMVGLAQTGTGKTAAFGLPIINHIKEGEKTTQALILSPTRELCLQITKDLEAFAQYKKGVRITAVYGGASIENQSRALKKGAHIIVATPGRMRDMINRRLANVSRIQTLVLDEADEMLNMGFKEELDSILETTPGTKRTLLFSATMSTEVERIASNYMQDPLEITIGRRNLGAENVQHYYYVVHAKDRYLALKRIADYHPNIYSIIFCRTRAETQEVAEKLMNDGYNADALHGDLSQAQRDTVMQKFRSHTLQMLVATDVAARGLDVEGLTHIINYNLPEEAEQYLHRSGRTGRAGKSGISIAIINLKEKYKIKKIEKIIGQKFKQKPIPNGEEVCEKQLFNLIDRIEKVDVTNEAIDDFLPTIYKKLEWLDKEALIKRFVSIEFNHLLDYYQNAPDLNIKDHKGKGEMKRFFINLGRKNDLSPPKLIGLINEISRHLSISIGKIDIMHSFSFFDADSRYTDEILTAINRKHYQGQKVIAEVAEPYKGKRSQKSSSPKKKKKKEASKGTKKKKKKNS